MKAGIEWLLTTLKSIADAVIATDADRRVIFMNPAASRLTGWAEEEAAGKFLPDVLPLIDSRTGDPIERPAAKAMREGHAVEVPKHTALITRDGRRIPIEDCSTPIRNAEGGIIGSVNVFRDITDRKQVDDSIGRREVRLRLATDAAGLGVFEWDARNDGIVWENDRIYEIFGRTREDGPINAAEFAAQIAHPDDAEAFRRAMTEAMQSGRFHFIGRFRRKDGATRWCEFTGRMEFAADGSPLRMAGVAADITNRKRAEKRGAAQDATARILAESRTLGQAGPQLLEVLCRNLDWEIGVLWSVDRAENALRFIRLWHSPSLAATLFESESRTRRFTAGSGLPGRVLATGKALWLANIMDEENFPRVTAAAREGLHAAIAFPILTGNETLGVMEFFSPEVRSPDEDLLELMNAIGRQIGQFIERERAEESLRESEARKAAILETALDCIITIDHEGRVIDFNAAAEKVFGYRHADAIGRPMAELIVPPHLRERHYQGMAHYLKTGEGPLLGRRVEITAMRADGSEFPAELAITAIRGENAPIFTGYLRDITDRKRGEQAVIESERRLRAAVEGSPFPIMLHADDGDVLALSRSWTTLTGYQPEELRTHFAWIRLAYPDRSQEVEAQLAREFASDAVIRAGEFAIRTQAGGERIWDFQSVPLGRLPDGRRLQMSAAMDVTERKRDAEQLRESEEKFRTLADNMPQLAWMADKTGWIFWYNKRWHEYTGSKPDQMEGWGWESVHDPDVLPNVIERWQGSIESGEPFDMVFPLKGADGVFRPFLTRVMPVRDEAGTIVQWFGTNTDITERIEADRRKDEFLAMLAHELRNPLASVGNAIQLLKMPHIPAEHAAWSRDIIERQVKHLARLIDDLLDVSRITRGKVELRKERIEVSAVINSAVDAARPLMEEKKQELAVSFTPGTLWCEVDPTRLEQILINLLTNATRYTPAGGHIRLSARHEGEHITFTVKDTGIGIPPNKLSEMFELFAQGDRTIARSEGGLGIGLTIVKRIAELHGGAATASSEGIGKGSEFTVTLPAIPRPQPTAAKTPAANQEQGRRSRILVVDDNVDTARGLARLLKLLGHEIRTAHDGSEAITEALAFRPEFILLDIGLPGMDGYQVAKRIRGEGLQDAVIIAVSGYGQEEDRRRSKEAGFNHHLVKPVDYNALVSLIAQPVA